MTILLSQTVFSLLVSHVLTRTSEAVPLIGTDSPFLYTLFADDLAKCGKFLSIFRQFGILQSLELEWLYKRTPKSCDKEYDNVK